ncbi:hypothetical protein QAD02_006541 [Eretmocerus hayati]|uniref:Uncharacterized protein n=1 Tax=Eretmocerus hayati TaxID=131215 RepID=A0ACC2N3I1_9HYME|nr:hypothetical protein QAD02_006541 [Eretmocerus hayati]
MELATIILVALVCYGIYAYLQRQYRYFLDLGVPYVPPIPFFGNIAPVYLCRKHQNDLIKDLYNYHPENPKYIGVFDFFTPIFVIRDPELAKELLIKNSDNFIDRYQFFENIHGSLFDNNFFTMQGEKWRETRNSLTLAFTLSKMKTMFQPILECDENRRDQILKAATVLKILLARASPMLFKILGVKFSKEDVTNFFTDIVRKSIEMRDKKGIARLDMLQLMMDARGKTSEELQLDLTLMTSQAFIFLLGDKKFHENPEEFNPDRYVGKKLSTNQVDNLGFGIGLRSCIGYRFGVLAVKIMFFHLLAKFTFVPCHKTCKDFKYKPGSFRIVPKNGYWFAVEPRT